MESRFSTWTIEMAEEWEQEVTRLVSGGMDEERAEEIATLTVEKRRELLGAYQTSEQR